MRGDSTAARDGFPVTESVPIVGRGEDAVRSRKKRPGLHGCLWVFIVAAGGLFGVFTAPGQTAGLSPLTDPLIESLNISRTDISLSYLFATLAGAAAMPLFMSSVPRN